MHATGKRFLARNTQVQDNGCYIQNLVFYRSTHFYPFRSTKELLGHRTLYWHGNDVSGGIYGKRGCFAGESKQQAPIRVKRWHELRLEFKWRAGLLVGRRTSCLKRQTGHDG